MWLMGAVGVLQGPIPDFPLVLSNITSTLFHATLNARTNHLSKADRRFHDSVVSEI